MAEKKKTILMSTDKSKETWQPTMSERVLNSLKSKTELDGFSLEYQPNKVDTFKVGAVKKQKNSKIVEKATGDDGGGVFFGARYTRNF